MTGISSRFDQEGSVGSGQRSGDFVAEVHVSRCVDEVEHVSLSVMSCIVHPHGYQLDRDATLAFQFQRVKHLGHHLAARNGICELEQSVGQGRLSMVHMGNDAEISDVLDFHLVSPLGGTVQLILSKSCPVVRPWGIVS